MRCIATANPSRVKRPSLLRSARSLADRIRLYLKGDRDMDTPNLSKDLFRQFGLQHEGNCNVAFNVSSFVSIQGIKEMVRAGLFGWSNIPETCSLGRDAGKRWDSGCLSDWRWPTGGKCRCQIRLTCKVYLHRWLLDRRWE